MSIELDAEHQTLVLHSEPAAHHDARLAKVPAKPLCTLEKVTPPRRGMHPFFKLGAWAIGLVLACMVLGHFLAGTAHAQGVIGIHTVSMHAPAKDHQQNENWGIYYRTPSNWTFGYYKNTHSRPTFYAGRSWDWSPVPWLPLSASIGLATGYQEKIEPSTCEPGQTPPCYAERGFARGAVAPFAAFSVAAPKIFGITPALSLVPGFISKASTVVHLRFEAPL